jgi:hypothetical protein
MVKYLNASEREGVYLMMMDPANSDDRVVKHFKISSRQVQRYKRNIREFGTLFLPHRG